LEQKSSKQSAKILKCKDRLNSIKTKCIDKELEISKKNTEIDILRLEKTESIKKISKMEIVLNDKNQQLSKIEEVSEFQDIDNKDNLNSEFSDYYSINPGQLNLIEKNKRNSENSDLRKSGENEEEIEFLKGENEILMQKCKTLTKENEINRDLIGKLETSIRNLQKEKDVLSAQAKCLIKEEIDLQSNVENKVNFEMFSFLKINFLNKES